MEAVLQIADPAQAAALLQPIRLAMMRQLAGPRTCTELAESLGATVQQVNYHMRKLEEHGLVERVEERRVRGTIEGIFQARAATIWLSPRLVALRGAERTRGDLSLGYLLSLAEDLQLDAARLAARSGPAQALGLSANIEFADAARRAEFLAEVRETFERLAANYGTSGGGDSAAPAFKLMLACYEDPDRGPAARTRRPSLKRARRTRQGD